MTNKLTTALRASSLGMAVLFTLLFTLSSAFGADTVTANVPFQFHAGPKTLPAGACEFKIDRGTDVVTVTGGQPRSGAEVLIVTSMAATPHSSAKDAHIVFDKVGTTYTLSEIWEPGADGVLLHVTKGKHEHHVLHLKP